MWYKKRVLSILIMIMIMMVLTCVPSLSFASAEDVKAAEEPAQKVEQAFQTEQGANEDTEADEAATKKEDDKAYQTEKIENEDVEPAEEGSGQEVEQALQNEQTESESVEPELISKDAAYGVIDDSYVDDYELGTGSVVRGTVDANSTVAYRIYNYDYCDTCNLYVMNESESDQSVLNVCVLDEYEMIKSELTPDEVVSYKSSDTDVNGTSYTLEADYWVSAFYTLSSDDYIVLSAGSEPVDYAFRADFIDSYVSVCSGETASDSTISGHAALIPLNFNKSYERSAVVYFYNNSNEGYRFNCYVLSGDGDMIQDKDGYTWSWLDPGYYANNGYNLTAGKEYYAFICPSLEEAAEYDHDYDFDGDYEIGLSPQNLKYYSFHGIKNKVYTGKALKQSITSDYHDLALYSDEFKITYSNNKNVGTATVTIKGVEPFIGTVKKTFVISPKGTALSKVTRGRKSFTVKWKKQAGKMSNSRINGYQIQYSTDSKFKKGNKTITVKGYNKTSKKISKLKAKKKYYVRIRTYKTVYKKNYYSGWSKAKAVKTK